MKQFHKLNMFQRILSVNYAKMMDIFLVSMVVAKNVHEMTVQCAMKVL